jgi:hypothetical protein
MGMLATLLYGCNGETTATPLPANVSMPEESVLSSGELFLESESSRPTPSAGYILRSRVVKINYPLLLDDRGQARELTGKTITLNLFADVIYTGEIEQVEENGDSYTWIGQLQDVEFSSLTMILTEGVFIAKIASPDGVYEVSSIGGDQYRVILINQQNLQGGEDAVEVNPSNP